MKTIKSPFSSRTHIMAEYDDDYLVNNSTTQEKKTHDVNVTAMTQPNCMLNRYSVKKEVYNDVVLDEFQLNSLGERNAKRMRSKNWRNW